MHSQDSSALKAANKLLRTISSNVSFQDKMASTDMLIDRLHKMGFAGLSRFSSQDLREDIRQACFNLTERLIEVRLNCLLIYYINILTSKVNNYIMINIKL